MTKRQKQQKQQIVRRALTYLAWDSEDCVRCERSRQFTCCALEMALDDFISLIGYRDRLKMMEEYHSTLELIREPFFTGYAKGWEGHFTPEIQSQRFLHLCNFLHSL